ncbi:hypothetical protein M758_3G045200, partial [Ceratodon purpureus]
HHKFTTRLQWPFRIPPSDKTKPEFRLPVLQSPSSLHQHHKLNTLPGADIFNIIFHVITETAIDRDRRHRNISMNRDRSEVTTDRHEIEVK